MKIINKIFTIILIFFLSTSYSRASLFNNNTLKGNITDASTGKPIRNVNIYLAYTMTGTTSDENGNFKINNIAQGTYDIIFSHVNYKKQNFSFQIIEGKNLQFTIKLIPKIYELEPVPVVSDIDDWESNLKKFKERLIGTSTFADKMELTNPEIIDFSENEIGNLIASANKPLLLINNALGYKVTYYLEYFEADPLNTKYSGVPFFEELKTENVSLKEKWSANRKKAYLGSLRHFLTLVCANYDSSIYYKKGIDSLSIQPIFHDSDIENFKSKLDYFSNNNYFTENGYIILTNSKFDNKYVKSTFISININNYLTEGNTTNELFINSLNNLVVRYNRENPDENYYTKAKDFEKNQYPISSIDFLADSVSIDKKGRYFDKFMIRAYGYWAFERLAETVPYEYEPEDE